jgi:hypothetical protein
MAVELVLGAQFRHDAVTAMRPDEVIYWYGKAVERDRQIKQQRGT